ncbi:hypothetical protein HF086_001830 [Spodoptera exigua]|uniref:Uncharacterized protein n=1 Tax=Spodoptera exigua TaxID=7107 RepID=A0A922MUJ8_SPOEX|nr:hypothetical protein HF086_001830 [Spodoptera exigua]
MIADGCDSQNKNTVMIAMVAYWLTNCAPRHVKIVLIFPVPGHSFMPADRIFGHNEKEVKNKEIIINPSEYIEIYNRYGTVHKMGEDCAVKYWKAYASETLKPAGNYHFQFAACKRYYVTRVKNKPDRFLLRGEIHYKNDTGLAKSVIKRGVSSTSEFGIRDIPPYQTKVSTLRGTFNRPPISNSITFVYVNLRFEL